MTVDSAHCFYHLDLLNTVRDQRCPSPTALIRPDSSKRCTLSTVTLNFVCIVYRWLKVLDLSFNGLTELPDSIGYMKSLKEVYVQNNQLEALPDTLGEHQVLQTLNAAENVLADLPNDIRNWRTLEVLLLPGNRLSQMPKSFKFLEMLHTFDVSSNSFVTFPFPDNAGKVLKSVKIKQNPWRLPPVGGEDNRSLITKIHK